MKLIFLVLFGGAAALNYAAIFLGRPKLQGTSKVFLMPFLLGAYVSAADRVLLTVVLALIFGWIGDILLLKGRNKKFFILGLIGFLIGHLFYIPSFLHFTGGFSLTGLFISGALALPSGIILYRVIRPIRIMKVPLVLYECTIVAMSLSALQLFLYRRDPVSAAVFAGSLFFLVSDSILGYSNFRKQRKYVSFLIMLFYLAAQGCIVLGLAGC
jgi:uncharacterized membrane protein YhhN